MECVPFEFASENYPLADATLYGVGGAARVALFPRNAAEAREAYVWAAGQGLPFVVLGNGSNVLIADSGFQGIVLFTTGLCGVVALDDDRYRIESGASLSGVVRDLLVPGNYEGVGALTGIPGSVGGALYMNAGTVNGAVCEWVESVALVTQEGPSSVLLTPELYGYRSQRFCPPGALIVDAVFRFRRSAQDQRAVYEHYQRRRKETQPQGRSCGCVFKNPPGDHAGRLIDACGLKGTRRGGAEVSVVHANFIINRENATCADILELIALCKGRVRDEFGIELVEEVQILA